MSYLRDFLSKEEQKRLLEDAARGEASNAAEALPGSAKAPKLPQGWVKRSGEMVKQKELEEALMRARKKKKL